MRKMPRHDRLQPPRSRLPSRLSVCSLSACYGVLSIYHGHSMSRHAPQTGCDLAGAEEIAPSDLTIGRSNWVMH